MNIRMTAQLLAERLQGAVEGDGELHVTGVAAIRGAGATEMTFAENARGYDAAYASAAGVILVQQCAPPSSKTLIRVANSREAFAIAMGIFHPPKRAVPGIHSSAHIAAGVMLGQGVTIGEGAVVGVGAVVGDRSAVLAHCTLGEGSVVGDDCVLHPHVTIYDQMRLGARVIVHSGTVIGSDGFGYVRKPSGLIKIPQVGNVVVGDDVEIGANVTIDRATLDSTVIGSGTKIDNQVQSAHHVIIGANCLIAGLCGIGGSSRLGDRVTLAGGVAVVDHVEIGANAVVGAMSLVTKNVASGQVVWGTPARPAREARRETVAIRRLPELLIQMRSPSDAYECVEPEPMRQ